MTSQEETLSFSVAVMDFDWRRELSTMEEGKMIEGLVELPPPSCLVVGIAINGKKKSKHIVKWALEKFVPEGKVMFKLLHVRPKITAVPTPMGNSLPLSHARDDVAAAYIKEVEWQTNQILLPYKRMCVLRKVQVEIVQIESDSIVDAIAAEITKCSMNKLVIGASSRSMFSRGRNLSSKISQCTPRFCTVYAVLKGKLSSVRPSDSETNGSIKDDCSDINGSTSNSSSDAPSSHAEETHPGSAAMYSHFQLPSLPMQQFEAPSTINKTFLHSRTSSIGTDFTRSPSVDIEEGNDDVNYCPHNSGILYANSQASSSRSLVMENQSWTSEQPSTSDATTDFSSDSQINFELEKLRIEIKHIRGIYAIAQSEKVDASKKLSDLQKRRQEEAIKLREINFKEEKAKELAKIEKEQCEAAKREADCVKECARWETAGRIEAEARALRDNKEREKLEHALAGSVKQYQIFTWEEIVFSSSSFSEDLRIGMGAYGTVYKCSLHHTTTAVKVLHSQESYRNKQFQQELEILSRVHHPHLLILIGACPDHGCLVYEYMEHGSLEDRLFRKDNTLPIPWFERYRIAWEVASALSFLHNSKPKPIIHRDLKPANILLDHNLVSKIGDVGLSTMLNTDPSSVFTMYKDTSPVGTVCYMDPEYQRTGLVSVKSDVYAFGMVILQLLTAKPAIGLAHMVETAIDDGNLVEILDMEAGTWPIEETKELAKLGLSCTELRSKDRPNLKDQVLPALEKLKEIAARYKRSGIKG